MEDRFPEAKGGLDFYPASHPLWPIAYDQFGEGKPEARQWVEPLLHRLKHGGEPGVLKTLEDLLTLCAKTLSESHETPQREVEYFQSHRNHLHYQQLQEEGCPIGSGSMKSACSQFQDRFKRTGQLYTIPGKQHILALELARRNNDWDEIWELAA